MRGGDIFGFITVFVSHRFLCIVAQFISLSFFTLWR